MRKNRTRKGPPPQRDPVLIARREEQAKKAFELRQAMAKPKDVIDVKVEAFELDATDKSQ